MHHNKNHPIAMVDGPGSDIPSMSKVCSTCHHYVWPLARHCAAFPEPESIPLPIWLGEHDHTTPYPGDHGIRYQRITREEAERRYQEGLRQSIADTEEYLRRLLERRRKEREAQQATRSGA